MIIEEIKKAISKSAVSGSYVQRYYYSYVPQNTPFPYVSYYILLDSYSGNDSGTKYSDIKIQFNVYSDYSDYGKQCNDIVKQITDYYDNGKDNLSVSGSTIINMKRDFIRPPMWVESVWQGVIQYTCHIT